MCFYNVSGRKVAMDESSAIAASAPSLLDMNIEVPDFLKGQEWEEGDEPFIEDAKQRAAEMAAVSGEPDQHPWNENSGLPPDHPSGHGRPPYEEPASNFSRNTHPHFDGPRYDGPPTEGQNFEDHRLHPFDGPRDGPRDGPFEDPRGPNFDQRRGNFPGPRGPPRNDWDNNRPPPHHYQNENYNGPRYNEPGPPRVPPGFRPGGRFNGPPPREHFDPHDPRHPNSQDFPLRPNPDFNDQHGGRWEEGRRNERWQDDRMNR